MSSSAAAISEAIAHFGAIVSSDGGNLELERYDEPVKEIVVNYRPGSNEECRECVITPETLEVFLREAFAARNLDVTVEVRLR